MTSTAPRPARPFGAVGTAMVTPLTEDGHGVDLDAAQRLADHVVRHGNDMIVVSGTTGEAPTLTDVEKLELARAVKSAVDPEITVVAGVGTYDTAHSIDLAREHAKLGVDGLLVVTPYYSKPSQAGIIAHTTAIADSTDLPVMLYDIPGRAGAPIITDTLLRLSDHPNILAVKDAKGDLFASSFVMNNSSLVYYSGEDALNLPLLSLGALGLVSVAGHVCSDRFASMVRAVANNDLYTARTLSRQTADVVDALMNHMPGVISAKAALQAQGILDNRDVRMPLLPADEEQVAFVTAQLTRSGYLSE